MWLARQLPANEMSVISFRLRLLTSYDGVLAAWAI